MREKNSAPSTDGCVNFGTKYRVIGIMGWHDAPRSHPGYRLVAKSAWQLSRPPGNYAIVTGGGPGMMEAGNLGAYLSNYSDPTVVDQAIDILKHADRSDEPDFVSKAKEVIKKFPRKNSISIAISTWFYGDESTNLFATHIAKYFSNSIREDQLVTRPAYGIIFALGSAGTAQEVFQDAVQNHYASFGEFSPMVFLDEDNRKYVDVLKKLSCKTAYIHDGYVSDILSTPGDVIKFITEHCPHTSDSTTYTCP